MKYLYGVPTVVDYTGSAVLWLVREEGYVSGGRFEFSPISKNRRQTSTRALIDSARCGRACDLL